ncbi:LuxR C-terminal-related transcriptional regulator [Peptoniphilus sp. MSJ-1]|uniref:LuxR C-terminal-related transcriptional regulator n=1 Tax=Peptoniphilus ovalis TaxID=2841503 RepID=A0ABS6FL12_9FIRM|nr:LuxR C-terminal-related transcriptional regulator [Peptoniphilus ovalis]MBU5670187.1 LuxR C-terminal-related transcriptional regulator [Peptoniphilus ovalis]
MTNIAIQTDSHIIKVGLKEILKDYEVFDYNKLENLQEIDLLLFEKEELAKEKVRKIRLLKNRIIPLNNDYSIIRLDTSEDSILEAIDKTLRNHIYIEEKLKELKQNRIKKYTVLKELSRREKYLIEEIIRGKSNKEISQTIYISEKTVKNNLTKLYKKLEVKGRDDLRINYYDLIIYSEENN